MPWFWNHLVGHWVDHVVKAELKMLMRPISAKFGWDRPVGIEDRDYMAYTGLAVRRQFFDTANDDLKQTAASMISCRTL
jgi:hypothetical protein